MEKLDAAVLAGIQKAHDVDIHERHAFEVQRNGRLLALELYLQFMEMLGLQPTVQADNRLAHVDRLFNS